MSHNVTSSTTVTTVLVPMYNLNNMLHSCNWGFDWLTLGATYTGLDTVMALQYA